MFYQNHINIDSLKAAQDSLRTIAEKSNSLNTVTFDLSKIGNDEIILTVLGYGIVFLALLILYLFFANLTKLINITRKKRLKAAGKESSDKDELPISGETTAAISLALALQFQEAHDFENTVITIKKVQSAYSPWNSKLYGLRQNPKY
ncbi:MAG: OadG family protein [Ignavibacteriales bacterium]|nr:OadG family protein [Ignavibacteriales bacterium]MCB9258124.1 OadG family protein [Ignavibacteriales bacterium]